MNVYLDMDGVLCNSLDLWHEWVANKYNVSLDKAHSQYWSYIRDTFGPEALSFWAEGSDVYDKAIPFVGAVDFCKTLVAQKYNIKVVTSTFEGMSYEKIKWFRKHIPALNGCEIICIPSTSHKSPYTKNGVLIDDSFQVIAGHVANNNMPGILFNYDDKYSHVRKFKYCKDNYQIMYYETFTGIMYQLEYINSPELHGVLK
jgi:hypothetical protein